MSQMEPIYDEDGQLILIACMKPGQQLTDEDRQAVREFIAWLTERKASGHHAKTSSIFGRQQNVCDTCGELWPCLAARRRSNPQPAAP